MPERMPERMSARWPSRLWIVRHGESAGNVAARDAVYEGQHHFRLNMRDADVPLSGLGQQQADALGRWFAHECQEMPELILTSPYARARETAERTLKGAGLTIPIIVDERLREKETGILDGLTPDGVAALFPDQAEQRRIIGKFYHRPPGGENWCDVILRLRSLMNRLSIHNEGQRVLIVAHEVVVFCLRYIIEDMDEAHILSIDEAGDVANCGITEYAVSHDTMQLVRFNATAAMEEEGAPVTLARDAIAARRG